MFCPGMRTCHSCGTELSLLFTRIVSTCFPGARWFCKIIILSRKYIGAAPDEIIVNPDLRRLGSFHHQPDIMPAPASGIMIVFWYHAMPAYIISRESLMVSCLLIFGIPFLFSSRVPGSLTESEREWLYHFSEIPTLAVSKANFQEPLRRYCIMNGNK
jgi:hypothetical protein